MALNALLNHRRRSYVQLSPEQIRDLSLVAGDHTASEAKWVEACLLLGDYKPESTRKASARRKAATTLLVFCIVAIGAGSIFLKNYVRESQHSSDRPELSTIAQPQAAEPDFDDFMTDLSAQIKRAWNSPKVNKSYTIVVFFTVDRDGSVSKLHVTKSSKNKAADLAALKAVRNGAPYYKLPVSEKNADVEFTFDYNVFDRPELTGSIDIDYNALPQLWGSTNDDKAYQSTDFSPNPGAVGTLPRAITGPPLPLHK